MKSAFWKNLSRRLVRLLDRIAKSFLAFYRRYSLLIQYLIGFGLLAYIIFHFWDATPGKPTDDQKLLSLVAGAAVDVEAQRAGTRPGLVEVFSQPINPWPFALACVLWVICLFITFIRWWLLVRAQDLPFSLRNAIRLGS